MKCANTFSKADTFLYKSDLISREQGTNDILSAPLLFPNVASASFFSRKHSITSSIDCKLLPSTTTSDLCLIHQLTRRIDSILAHQHSCSKKFTKIKPISRVRLFCGGFTNDTPFSCFCMACRHPPSAELPRRKAENTLHDFTTPKTNCAGRKYRRQLSKRTGRKGSAMQYQTSPGSYLPGLQSSSHIPLETPRMNSPNPSKAMIGDG